MVFKKGQKHTKEHIAKIVATRKRNNKIWHSEETKNKMSLAHKGKKHNISEETRKEMSERMKRLNKEGKIGMKILTPEQEVRRRRNLSIAHKGMKKPWSRNLPHLWKKGQVGSNKGRKFSKEWLKNMSLSHKGKHSSLATEFKKGHIHFSKGTKGIMKPNKTSFKKGHKTWMKGKHHLEETKNKIRKMRAKQIFPIKDTSIEVKIQMFLKELEIDFFTHQYIKIEHGYQCDILIPSMNLIIECDGDYWHKYPIGIEIDHVRTKELIEKGFKVLRLWEKEIRVMNINNFKKRLFK